MQIEFVSAPKPSRHGVLAAITSKAARSRDRFRLDRRHGGRLAQAVAASRFTGGKGQTLDLVAPAGRGRRAADAGGRRQGRGLRRARRRARRGQRLQCREELGRRTPCASSCRRQRRAAGRARRWACGWRPIASTVPDQGAGRQEALDHAASRSPPPSPDAALAAFAPLAALADARELHPRPGLRAGQHPLSRRVRPPGEGAGEPGPGGRDPRRGRDDQARHGLACWASARAAVRESQLVGDPVERRGRQDRPADRLRRQGRLLRHRRHLHQAGRRHGRHEVGHGRRGRGRRPDARARRPQGQGQRRSASSAWSRTCPTATPSGPATWSPPCPARRSR